MAGGSLMIGNFNAGNFLVSLGTSYLIGRATAQDGPRLQNKEAANGDYGVPMPRVGGAKVRLTGVFIAQAPIKETKHTVQDYSEIVGAVTGGIQGFMIGGPIGAVIGAGVGALLGFATPNQHYYTYSDTFALLLADRTDDEPVEGLDKVWANGKLMFSTSQAAVVSQLLDGSGVLVWKKYGKNKYFKSLTLYTGHDSQPVDPVLAAILNEDGGYPYSAYVVVEDLQLAQFGNSVPDPELLFSPKAGETLAGFAEKVCLAAGVDNVRNMSSTALAASTLRGYAVVTEASCWDALAPLMPPFASGAAEVAGQVRFYRRSQTMRSTIPLQDMGAHSFGDSPPEKFTFRRSNDIDLPQETALTFVDPNRNYQPNTMTSRRSEGSAKSNVAVSINLVLLADEGASAAALMHWDAWLGRTAVSFSLTDAWSGIQPGFAYALPIADQFVPYRITLKTRGANGITEIEALSDESVTYTASESGDSGTIPPDPNLAFADTRLVLMDMSILEDVHDDYGFYVVMAGGEADWPRGQIQASSDGVTYATLIDSSFTAVVGDVTGTLAAGITTGLDDTLDTTSVLTVVLLHDQMTLSSATDAQLDAYANFAFVGKDGMGEYLQFKTATQIDSVTWQLTDLRRGRKGTDWAIAAHVSGEEFALLGGEGVFRIVYSDETDWGNPMWFRGVTLHQDVADAAVVNFTNTGEGKRPYSPINVLGSWDGSNNLTINCTPRYRLNAGTLGIDDRNEVEIEILNATPVRTIIGSGSSAVYPAANQTSDGIIPGDTVIGRIRRTSDVNDGRWRDFELIGPIAIINSETDTALALSGSSIAASGMATETDEAFALSSVALVNQFETLGNPFSVVGAGSAGSHGILIPITPAQTCDISSIGAGIGAATGQSAKALVYADSGGAPAAQIAVGTATSLGTINNTLVDLPFASPVTLTGGTTYWIGFVPSGSITTVDVNLAGIGTTASTGSVTYASPQANLSGLTSPGANKPVVWAKGAFAAALSGTDIVAQSANLFHTNTSLQTWVNLPKAAIDDVVLLQINVTNGSPPTLSAPSGFTLVSNPVLNSNALNGRNYLYMRVIDGTETGVVEFQCGSYNVLSTKLVVVRGIDISGSIYEGLATTTGGGTSVPGPAITTTGPDRLALGFFAAGVAGGTDLTGAADAWTDVYDHSTTLGTDAAISCTSQDVPSATTLTAETRTNAVSGSYAVVGLALIRA